MDKNFFFTLLIASISVEARGCVSSDDKMAAPIERLGNQCYNFALKIIYFSSAIQ